jgi:hypothetical protein
MKDLVENIINKQYDSANELFESTIDDIVAHKLLEAKKIVSARMTAESSAFLGMPGSNSEKRKRGVLEMDLSKEKPDYASIEDKRGTKDPNWFMKNVNVVKTGSKTKAIVAKQPDQPDQVVQKTAMKESDDLGPVRARKEAKTYKRKSDGKEIAAVKHPGKEWELVKEETLDEARFKIVKARVRGGKVQRRKRISNVEGFKMQDGTLKRMSPAERRKRKLGQKRGKLKRRSKMRMAMMKRKRSLRKRTSIGL